MLVFNVNKQVIDNTLNPDLNTFYVSVQLKIYYGGKEVLISLNIFYVSVQHSIK